VQRLYPGNAGRQTKPLAVIHHGGTTTAILVFFDPFDVFGKSPARGNVTAYRRVGVSAFPKRHKLRRDLPVIIAVSKSSLTSPNAHTPIRQHADTLPQPTAHFDRNAHFHRNPLGRASWLFFRVARSTRMTQIWVLYRQSGSDRLEKHPTDLRQYTCCFGDRTLEAKGRQPRHACRPASSSGAFS
jgi:hypothetical protein